MYYTCSIIYIIKIQTNEYFTLAKMSLKERQGERKLIRKLHKF